MSGVSESVPAPIQRMIDATNAGALRFTRSLSRS
jgi:hypothetical protein